MQEAQAIESRAAPTRLTANWVPAAIVLGLGLGFAVLYGVVIVIAPPEPYLEFLSYYLYQLAPIAALMVKKLDLVSAPSALTPTTRKRIPQRRAPPLARSR